MQPKKYGAFDYILAVILLLVCLFIGYKIGIAFDDIEIARNGNVSARSTDEIAEMMNYIAVRLSETNIEWQWSENIQTALLWAGLIWLIIVAYYFTAFRKYIFGKEYGTAEWGTLRDIKNLFASNIAKKEIKRAKRVKTFIGRFFVKRKIKKECRENANSVLRIELNRLEEWKAEQLPKSKRLSKIQKQEKNRILKEYEQTKTAIHKEAEALFEQLYTEAWTPRRLKARYEADIEKIEAQAEQRIVIINEAQKREKMAQAKARYKADLKAFYHGKKRVEQIKKKYENADIHYTKTERISLHNYVLNNNSLIIGGAGSGKTRGFVMPSLLQAHSSFIITDPKGEILEKAGYFLEKVAGYKIRVLNLSDKKKSEGYNPFVYIHPEREGYEERVLTLIETIIVNTDGGEKKGSNEPFWDNAERLFLQAMFFFTCDGFVPEEQTINTVLNLIAMLEIGEEGDNMDSDLDYFADIFAEEHGEDHIGVQQYREFRSKASGRTAKSIVISAVARLAPFRTPEVKRIMSYDNMRLDRVGEEKTAIFVVVPPTDDTFNFISGMMFSQLFVELEYCATVVHRHEGQRLPIPVRFILDEFATTAIIPRFPKILAYARSFGIGISPIIQSLEQLKKMYKDEWGVIIDNCNTILYLGSIAHGETLDYMSKLLGKGTFDKRTSGRTRGRNSGSSQNFDVLGRDLMDSSEIRRLDKKKCLLIISGKNPFYSDKYEYTSHPNYKYTSDFNKAYSYDYIPQNPLEDIGADDDKQRVGSAIEYAKSFLKKIDGEEEIQISVNPKDMLNKLTQSFDDIQPIRAELLNVDDGEELNVEELLSMLDFDNEDMILENTVVKSVLDNAKATAKKDIEKIDSETEPIELITEPIQIAKSIVKAGENSEPIRGELLHTDEGEDITEEYTFDDTALDNENDVDDLGDILAEICETLSAQETIFN